jgi:hypothetical protein
VTVTGCPAIVTIAVRAVVDGLAVAENETLPFPVPDPAVTVSQPALLVAVQVHEEPAVTPTSPVLAAGASDTLVVDSV